MIDYVDDQINADRIEREKQRNEKSPICKLPVEFGNKGKVFRTCDTKTYYDKKCSAYVCPECETHYSNSDPYSKLNFCYCGWNKQNFDPLYAGETWDSEDDMFGDY